MENSTANKYRKSYTNWPKLLILSLVVFIYILSPTSATSAVDITLAWDASGGADGYRLFYREEGRSYTYNSRDWEGPGTTCTIYGLADSTTYHFVVRAYNSYGESGNSNEETYTPASSPVISRSPTSLSTSSAEGTKASDQTLAVWNSGGGTLDYTITDDVGWLSLSPTSGTSTGEHDTITVTYDTSGLSAGNYSATITISDSSASNSPQTIPLSLTVNAQSSPPSISLGTASISNSCTEGSNASSQTFNVRNSGGGTLIYSISDNRSWLSVSPGSGASTGEQDTITVNYNTSGLTAGTRNATITISDPNADNGPQTITVSLTVNAVNNQSPTARFTATPTSGDAPLDVSFNASSSSDPDGTIVSYSWAFGDGATGTGVSPSHTYTSAGTYSVRLTVTDNGIRAESDSTSMTITALDPPAFNLAPDQAVITSPYYSEMECDLLASIKTEPFSDPDGDTHSKSRWQIVKKQDSAVVLDITSSKNLTELPVPHAVLDRDTTYNVSVQFYDAHSEASELSDPVEFTTTSDIVDFDDDGIPDDREVDDTTDLNGDGIPDNNQPDEIKCVESAVAGHVAICVSKISVSIDAIEALETISPSEILDKKNKPNKFVFGLASYRLRVKQLGGIAIVRIYYSEDIAGAKIFYMYDSINGWQDYTEHVIFNEDGRSVTVELKDGGHGDSDGVANGIIVDPGGVATSVSTGGLLDSGAFKAGCFIATAAFGSYVEPHVKLLREFRDQYLLTNSPGRGFVKVYYKYGPFAADYIREHDWLKPIVRVLLMPLVGISYILVKTSLATKILIVLLMIISMSCKKPRQGERLFV